MIKELQTAKGDKYKQVYISESRGAPFTTARIGLDDYLHTHVWQRLRKQRLVKDNFQCKSCHTGINVEVHHIHYPEAWGLENVENDLITLCDSCHKKVHSTDIEKEK